ncbi:MAG TPA: hypothetical protein VGM81_24880 [Burkholderiaceae bacterium]
MNRKTPASKGAPHPAYLIALVVVGILAVAAFVYRKHAGELADQKKLAALQAVERQYHDNAQLETILLVERLKGVDGAFLGLPTLDKSAPRAWVLITDLDHDGELMMLPRDARLVPHCDQLKGAFMVHPPLNEVAVALERAMDCK